MIDILDSKDKEWRATTVKTQLKKKFVVLSQFLCCFWMIICGNVSENDINTLI